MRTFQSFERTVCDCEDCAMNCRFIPGYLLPEDLPRLLDLHPAECLVGFAEKYLFASPGAKVLQAGKILQVPTLVPARKPDGSCVFFDGAHCTVHPAAPFGCAFFDPHQTRAQSDVISQQGILILMREWELYITCHSEYASLWKHLFSLGLVAPSPEESRQKMAEYMVVKFMQDFEGRPKSEMVAALKNQIRKYEQEARRGL